jgi:hypothetical protein
MGPRKSPRDDARAHTHRAVAVCATATLTLALLGPLAGCGGRHHLDQYNFAGRTLALVQLGAPAPGLLTGSYHTDEDAIIAVLEAGAHVAREVEGRRARARLDSAATRVDVSARMARRTLERTARYLGARPVDSPREADFLLELDVLHLHIDARSSSAAFLFVEAEAILLDERTGREIWSERVAGRTQLTPAVHTEQRFPGEVVTAGALGLISVAEFERLLERLADFAADLVVEELREDLRDVRRGGG